MQRKRSKDKVFNTKQLKVISNNKKRFSWCFSQIQKKVCQNFLILALILRAACFWFRCFLKHFFKSILNVFILIQPKSLTKQTIKSMISSIYPCRIFLMSQIPQRAVAICLAFKVPRTTLQMILIHLIHCSTSSLLDENLPFQNLLEVCLFCQIAYFVSLFIRIPLFVINRQENISFNRTKEKLVVPFFPFYFWCSYEDLYFYCPLPYFPQLC